MPLTVPSLDDRTYQQLVREALARIPVHNPAWTNFNDSDPGVTLVQLFAFLTESLLYRANQIPERNRRKFLTLLGIPLQPAAAAQGLITIQNERGPLGVQTLEESVDLRAGPIRFRTTQGLDVLPVETAVFYKRKLAAPQNDEEQEERDTYRLLYADLLDQPDTAPSFYASTPLDPPIPGAPLPVIDLVNETVDRCLWIALLARAGDLRRAPEERQADLASVRASIAGRTLTVGVMPAVTASGVTLPAGQESPEAAPSRVVWEIAKPPPDGLLPPVSTNPAGRVASYALLASRPGTDVLSTPGLVELMLPPAGQLGIWRNLEPAEEGTKDFPPSLADTDIQDRVLTWIRLRVPQEVEGGAPQALFSWLGINATTVVQRTSVTGEVLGTGTGEPDQRMTLANTPVIPDSLTLTVNGEHWERIDDLLAADPEVPVDEPRRPLYLLPGRAVTGTGAGRVTPEGPLVKVYTLDPEAGEIRFGDGAHGMRPRRGEVVVASYAYGGGRQGNVGIGAINRSPQLPAGFKVANPLPTWGGDDPETVAMAEKTIPRVVLHRDRLVSVQDFKDVTWRTPGVDLGRVEVLPLYDAVDDLEPVPGVVTVVVVPRYDPLQPEAPQPDRLFLETVCRYLQPRRLVTTQIYIRGPIYKDVWVSVGIEALSGRATAPVIEAVKQELRTFLSPLSGGRSGEGWPLGAPILQRELEAVVARVDGVRLVTQVLLGGATGGSTSQLDLRSLELPRLVGIEVKLGSPVGLDELRSYTPPQPAGPVQVPIPVIPIRC